MTLKGPKIGKCRELVDIIALEKVLWAIDFVKIGCWAPRSKNSSRLAKMGLKGSKTCLLYTSPSPRD